MNDDVLMIVDIIASLVVKKLMNDEEGKGEEESSPLPNKQKHHRDQVYIIILQ